MLKLREIVFPADLARLPKDILKGIAKEIGVEGDNQANLAAQIFDKCQIASNVWQIVEEIGRPYLFAGKTSIAWYPLFKEHKEVNILEAISNTIGFNPLIEARIPDLKELPTQPKIFGGFAFNNEKTSCLLRLVYKSGVKKFMGMFPGVIEIPSIDTVIINEDEGFIEIRADHSSARKIASFFEKLLEGIIVPLERKNILAPFGNEIEKLADSLRGKLLETTAIPEELFEDLKAEQVQAIIKILFSIDEYFISGEFSGIENALREYRDNLTEEYLKVPFTAIVLAGLNKLVMSAKDADLRERPLFNVAQPYLQHQGGYISFPVLENGVEVHYTIKVGITTNTIFFVTPATERAIETVRKCIFRI